MNQLQPDGLIHQHLAGRTVARCFKDGSHLIVETECGHQIRIGWRSDDGVHMRGEPVFVNCGVNVVLDLPSVFANAGLI